MKKHRKFLKDLQTSEQFYNDQESRQIIGELIAMIDEGYNKQPKTDWIPCEERLPDKTMLCLCTVERGVTPYHGLNPIIDWWIVKENEQVSLFEAKKGHWKNQCNKVIAWQPLPQPYKKEGDSDAT